MFASQNIDSLFVVSNHQNITVLKINEDFDSIAVSKTRTSYLLRFYAQGVEMAELDLNTALDSLVFYNSIEGVSIDERDGREYAWKNINGQKWMTENLKYLPEIFPYNSFEEEKKEYFVYDFENDSLALALEDSLYLVHGALYNWAAALEACPEGWVLPSAENWDDFYEYVETMGKPKEVIGDSIWGEGAEDLLGFGFYPAGINSGNYFQDINDISIFWSATEGESYGARALSLREHYGELYDFDKYNGFSVRCLKK
ncbi:MAG: hypothetical protein GX801_03200 [Fibrobacter sp.]|nr:hypothetical protein [Fibrobacter sp.]